MAVAHQHQHARHEPGPGLHQNQHSINSDQPLPTPRQAFVPINLPPAYPTPVLHPLLALASESKVIYRPFPLPLPEHQGIPAVIVPGDTPVHLFFVRFSRTPGDYKVLAFPTGAFFTSVNDVLYAVHAALAGAGTERKQDELGEAKEGSMKLDSMGGWVWTGFVLGRDDVWELSLV